LPAVSEPPPPGTCANCGAPIPPRARACPACGADERTGWREASIYDGLDLPDSAYDGENPERAPGRRPVAAVVWVVTALVVLAAMTLALFAFR
jgi:zinc-ribbon domain